MGQAYNELPMKTGGLVHLAGGGHALPPEDSNADSMIGGAMKGLGNMLYGAGSGAAAHLAGIPGDTNELLKMLRPDSYLPEGVVSTLNSLPSAPTSEQIESHIPKLGNSQEESMGRTMGGTMADVGATDVGPGMALKGAKTVGKTAIEQLGPKAASMMEDYLTKIGGIAHAVPTDTKIMRASEAYAPQEGKIVHLTQSDRLKANEGELGGHEFSGHQLTKPEYADANAAWGVASPQESTKIINRNKSVPEGQSVWAPLIGSETQHQTNPHVFDPMLNEFYRQVRMGNLPPETAAKMKAALEKQQFTNGAKKGQLMFPNVPDVTNEEAIRNLGTTFENRGPLSDILFGAKGAGKTKGQIIDYNGMLQDMADKKSIGAPTHSIGTRIFTLDNGVSYRPDLHSAFPYILTGTDTGVSHAPIPKELALAKYIQDYKDFNGKDPGTWAFTRKPVSFQVTDKLLKTWQAAGHKEGGSISPSHEDALAKLIK